MADAEMKIVSVSRSRKRARSKSRHRSRVPRKLAAWAGGMTNKGPVPQSKIVNLRYFDQISLTPGGAGTIKEHVFRMASIFDPDRTGVGHQPLGHDQWANFYEHYEVVESVMTVWFIPQTDAGVGCSIRMSTNSTVFTDPNNAFEAPIAVKTFAGRGRGIPAKLVIRYTPKLLHGKDYDSGNGSATVGANPSYVSAGIIGASSAADAGTAPTVDAQVQIDYKVRFTSAKILTAS